MEKSHSNHPRTAWCVVNMFHSNRMSPLIRTNDTTFYSISYCNFQELYSQKSYTYSVISVKMKRLPGNTKDWLFIRSRPIRVRFLRSWADCIYSVFIWLQFIYLLQIDTCSMHLSSIHKWCIRINLIQSHVAYLASLMMMIAFIIIIYLLLLFILFSTVV